MSPVTSQPSGIPTTGSPSTSYPTSIELFVSFGGKLNLEYLSFSEKLNDLDTAILQTVITEVISPATKESNGNVKVSIMSANRMNDRDVALLFKVDVYKTLWMEGTLSSVPHIDNIFNSTKALLYEASGSNNKFITVLDSILKEVNGSSLTIFSSSTMTVDYYLTDPTFVTTSDLHEKLNPTVILAGVIGSAMGLALMIFIGSKFQRKRLSADDDERSLLGLSQGFSQELELSEYVKSSATDFEKVMSSSLHSLIPEQAP